MNLLNTTHDAALRSWVASANGNDTDFPIQNLPFGVAKPRHGGDARVVVAIGDQALDLRGCAREGFFDHVLEGGNRELFEAIVLNPIMHAGPKVWSGLRAWLSQSLREGSPMQAHLEPHLLAQSDISLLLPANIPDYTDFYSSLEHATNVGRIFRPNDPLLPNFKSLPIGYHGRSSSVIVSGTPVQRPCGQQVVGGVPVFGPSGMLDYEVELGAFFGSGGTDLGETISLLDAHKHLFGVCLLNDWSARDIQAWEYRPLGPFLSKSFATTISGWVVTLEALAPFRVAARPRDEGDAPLLPYLDGPALAIAGFDIEVEALIETPAMRGHNTAAQRLSCANASGLYWTFAQMLTHHSSNGCPMRSGDLLGSGTISGTGPGAQGSLLELTARGERELSLPGGEARRFLEDGDAVLLRARCQAPGARSIGFGECVGVVLPARI